MVELFDRKRKLTAYFFMVIMIVLAVGVFYLAASLKVLEDNLLNHEELKAEKVELLNGIEVEVDLNYLDVIYINGINKNIEVIIGLTWLVRAGIFIFIGLGVFILGQLVDIPYRLRMLLGEG